MITIKKLEDDCMSCSGCQSTGNLIETKIGLTTRQTTTIRLCESCTEILQEKLKYKSWEV